MNYAPPLLAAPATPEAERPAYRAFSHERGRKRHWLLLRFRNGGVLTLRYCDLLEMGFDQRGVSLEPPSFTCLMLEFYPRKVVQLHGYRLYPVVKAIADAECNAVNELGSMPGPHDPCDTVVHNMQYRRVRNDP